MKGIILAAGSGTRLHPLTLAVSKQLMPIYNKPMIYYPISTLMEAGINEILIITNPQDKEQFQHLLGDGSQVGCVFEYAVQDEPRGLAEAFIIGEKFIGKDNVCLILGDNIFYGSTVAKKMQLKKTNFEGRTVKWSGAKIFAYQVSDPERYGVVEFSKNGMAVSLEEKPLNPKSNYAVPGLYFYDNNVIKMAKELKPSRRGELEITDINKIYLERGELQVEVLDKGTAWLDTGTFTSLMQASQYVQVIEERQGTMVGCIEEIAYLKGFIDREQVQALGKKLVKSGYGDYLLHLS